MTATAKTSRQQSLRPDARNLYAQGQSVEQIAGLAGVSVATVYRWKKADAEADRPWQERGTEQPFDPTVLIRILQGRLMADAADKELTGPGYYDAILKAIQGLKQTLDLYGDLAQRLNAMHAFVAWTVENGSEEDLAVIRRLVPDYLDQLKQEHAS